MEEARDASQTPGTVGSSGVRQGGKSGAPLTTFRGVESRPRNIPGHLSALDGLLQCPPLLHSPFSFSTQSKKILQNTTPNNNFHCCCCCHCCHLFCNNLLIIIVVTWRGIILVIHFYLCLPMFGETVGLKWWKECGSDEDLRGKGRELTRRRFYEDYRISRWTHAEGSFWRPGQGSRWSDKIPESLKVEEAASDPENFLLTRFNTRTAPLSSSNCGVSIVLHFSKRAHASRMRGYLFTWKQKFLLNFQLWLESRRWPCNIKEVYGDRGDQGLRLLKCLYFLAGRA